MQFFSHFLSGEFDVDGAVLHFCCYFLDACAKFVWKKNFEQTGKLWNFSQLDTTKVDETVEF